MADSTGLIETAADRLLAEGRARTPARLFVGRSGASYRTSTLLSLREDHAAALDAVQTELDMRRDLGNDLVERFRLVEVASRAATKREYLRRPDVGRELSDAAQSALSLVCPAGATMQVVVGDGLSAAAVRTQVPALLPLLHEQAVRRGWSWGRPFFVRYCRVGILNGIGELLGPKIAVLLIGERPGLATAESLSAYMAYSPRRGDTDARRNLISNIHARGVSPQEAAQRIAALADKMLRSQGSGFLVKEEQAEITAFQPQISVQGPPTST